MPEPNSPGWGVLAALMLFIAGSVWLGAMAQRRIERGSFLQGYFLGNRSLGAWALALTATVQSGGTFMGFPALVYSHGWILALWIAGYMVVPISGFTVFGKRLAQLSRRTGALTVPDMLRERYGSPAAGLIASLLIMLFMTSMMIAQFKAGATVMKLAWPETGTLSLVEDWGAQADWPYLIGLAVFSVTVIGYTMIGGFLAGVWTDLFQSVMMVIGVVILLLLVVPAAGGLEQATRDAVSVTSPQFAAGPGYRASGLAFLTPSLALSFFFHWVWTGFSSPASMVRVMATESSDVLRKSIVLLSCYNCLIYIPLVCICIAGRALLPDVAKPDDIVPLLALHVTKDMPGGSLLSGLILAAPFGAVMATVSCYLLVIASGLVKDIYLRFIRPQASVNEIRCVTYLAMALAGAVAIGANLRPVPYLQALVVFAGSGAAATFAVAGLMSCYWRRASAPGAIAAMLGGAGTLLIFFTLGTLQRFAAAAVAKGAASPFLQGIVDWLGPDPQIGIGGPFVGYFLLGIDPLIWSLAVSLVAGVGVSLCTAPPDPARVSRMFDVRPAANKPNEAAISPE